MSYYVTNSIPSLASRLVAAPAIGTCVRAAEDGPATNALLAVDNA